MVDRETAATVALLVVVAGAIGAVALWLDPGATDDDRATELHAGATVVRSCTTLDEPGRYVLSGDVADSEADTCLHVRSDDVIVDGRGHTVDGVGAFGTAGVVVGSTGGDPRRNVTVRNLSVTGWDDGLRVLGVEGGRIVGVTAADNRVGIDLLDARQVTVADAVARDNRLRGVSLVEASANNTLRNVSATGNAVYGVTFVGPGVRNNTLVGSTASTNEFGVALIGAADNALVDTVASDNRIAGVWLSAAAGNTVTDGRVERQFYGVFLSDGARNNTVRGTLASSNRVGLRLRSAHGNALVNNTVRSNRDTAVLLIASDDNRVVGTVGTGNARGIVVLRSSGNVLRDNDLG